MDRLERLINLIIALRATRRPMTAAEIRDRVAGYEQPDREAFRRMFERDKADLRAMGVPIETAPIDVWEDQLGYRIDPKDYDLEPVNLTAAELTALALALRATSLHEAGQTGLVKLQVDADERGLGDLDRVTLNVDLDTPHRDMLMEAQLNRARVRFGYRTATGEVTTRTVDPHALVHRQGRWYVVGHDHDRGGRRSFRLDRIEGEVTLASEAGAFTDPAERATIDDVLPEEVRNPPRTAIVRVRDTVAWQVARRAQPVEPGDWTRFRVGVSDAERFVPWALSFGADLVVEEPEDLKAAVIDALQRTREMG